MPQALFRFYAELNDFLPAPRRQAEFLHAWNGPAAVKDVLESLGVPHPEIDIILVNGRSVGFEYLLAEGDRVSVYPVFEALDVTPLVRLRPRPLRVTRFVLDVHLGRLAAYLRMLGFDTLWPREADDAALARCSHDEQRLLLTRDRGLLKRREVTRGYCVRAARPRQQLLEVVAHFDLGGQARPFTRCTQCNGMLAPIARELARGAVPLGVAERFEGFTRCQACGRVFWPGSHYDRMRRLADEVLGSARRQA
jgi:uncharacterized protein with PIN domain